MDRKTKVSLIVKSIKDNKTKYIEILTPKGICAMKIMVNVDDVDLVSFLDEFFDAGFTVRKITKEDYDTYEAEEKINFIL